MGRAAADTVVASGEVVPDRKAQLSFTVAGRVATLTVAAGDTVAAGVVLATLDTGLLDAQVVQAQTALAAAQAQLSVVKAGPRPGVAAAERNAIIAYDQRGDDLKDWQEEEIVLRLRAATLGREAAEAGVDLAEKDVEFRARAAEAAIRTAETGRSVAHAQLELAHAGVTDEEISIAESVVVQAEAALQAARLELDQAILSAPFAGTVSVLEVSPGEIAMPGQVLVQLADLDHLRVQTSDLSERDVTGVAMGDEAAVYVDALDIEVRGRVVEIDAQATTIGGDVVYPVVIELDEQPEGLRWGMSVEVEITLDGVG